MRYLPYLMGALTLACASSTPEPVVDPVPEITMPEVAPLPAYIPPVPVVTTLDNGDRVWVVEDHQLPLVSVRMVIPRGAITDADGAWGTASLSATMLHESAGERTALEMAGEWKLLAADFGVSAGIENLSVGLDVGTDNLDTALGLAADALLRPQMTAEDFERVSRLHINGLKHAREDAPTLAAEVAQLHFFGADHPLSHPASGTPQSAGTITLEQVKAFHQDMLLTDGIEYVVVGDISPEDAKAKLEAHFGTLGGDQNVEIEMSNPAPITGPKILLVDMPGAAQTAIRAVGPGLAAGDDAYPQAYLASIVLGGSFTSRLNNLLREQKGYTYGARARLAAYQDLGLVIANTSVRTETTADALKDMLGVLSGAKDGFSEGEVQKAHAQYLSRNIRSTQTRSGIANSFAGRASLGLAHDGWAEELAKGLNATGAQMQEAAAAHINPEAMLIVLVGDKAAIAEPLQAAGFEFEDVSPLP